METTRWLTHSNKKELVESGSIAERSKASTLVRGRGPGFESRREQKNFSLLFELGMANKAYTILFVYARG